MNIIEFYVALLLAIVLSGVRAETITAETLDKMATEGKIIDGIFKPLENGSLGSGDYGFAYKGQFLPLDNMTIAMKFSHFDAINVSNNEYEMYTYLDAVNNPSVMDYGIPAIYYYGKWKNYTMLAMTLLDLTFHTKTVAENVNESDIFILLREFVRVIKYIHSRGIIHIDLSFDNIVIKNGQGFIFDFGLSMDMAEISRRQNIEWVKHDFYTLFRSMFVMFKYELPESCWDWIGLSEDRDEDRMGDWHTFANEFANDASSNEWNSFTTLRRVLVEFAQHAVYEESASVMDANGSSIPFYDHLYRFIIEEMQNNGMGATSSNPSISDIPDPFATNEWNRTTVKYELFEGLYAKQISDARRKEKDSSCD